MIQIADLGLRNRRFSEKKDRWGLFVCENCKKECEKIASNGINRRTCSNACKGDMMPKYCAIKYPKKIRGMWYVYMPEHKLSSPKGYVQKELINE